MFDLNISFDAEKALADLEKFASRAIPFAAREALNSSAFVARKAWQQRIQTTFTLRNSFTAKRSLSVEKAKGLRVDSMVAILGSTADYMGKQERGGTTSGPVPGPGAAGQAAGGKRTRPVRIPVRTVNAQRGKGRTRAQRNAVAIAKAKRSGGKAIVLDRPSGGVGLFLVQGGKRRIKLKLLWAVKRGASRLRAHPTLGPALRDIQSKLPALHHDAVLQQLRRHKVFGY